MRLAPGLKLDLGPYFKKVQVIFSLNFKINLIFYFMKKKRKILFLNSFMKIEDQI